MNDASSFSARTSRSQRTVTVDNFLRKALRVSDPRDPGQIAQALLDRYPQEAERDRRERAGLPYSSLRDAPLSNRQAGGSGLVELETARGDLERDLATLTTLSQLKDISVELSGWGRAVRKASADGMAAARLSLDAVSHDSALAARRTLSDYARLARFVGVLSDGSGLYFRRFAQSCDVLSALILVAIGDGLAAQGITRSTAIVRVSASELQARRNAVIMAFRGLTGSVESALGQEEYPRGIVGYQMLVRQIENGGQADLRALLEENALAAAMDQLVDLTTGSSVDGLRELSTTASFLIHRFTRLIQYGRSTPAPLPNGADDLANRGAPESPPLLTFVAALQLFIDAFNANGSSRLLYIARPPILSYGLYSSSDNEPVQRLIALTLARNNVVQAIDCLAGCGCDLGAIQCIAMFDFVLSMIDRAIDLYAVGTDPSGRGEPERRAVAAGLLAQQASNFARDGIDGGDPLCLQAGQVRQRLGTFRNLLVTEFLDENDELDADTGNAVFRELRIAYAAERQTERLVRNLAAGCGNLELFQPDFGQGIERQDSLIRFLIRRTMTDIDPDAVIDLDDTLDLPQTVARSNSGQTFGDADFRHFE